MARRRQDKTPSSIKLQQPDRSGPTEKTLLELADERGLFEQAQKHEREIRKEAAPIPIPRAQKIKTGDAKRETDDDDETGFSPGVERVFETVLWSVSLATLHFTFDVLVQHQYNVDSVVWPKVWARFGQAVLVFGLLVYVFHPHPANPGLIPGLPPRYQSALRQIIFFATSLSAGCYLIYITNSFGYLAIMKRAPPLGCLWVWSVIELELPWAILSLSGAASFVWAKGYSIK
ncbi:hypothetical protein B0J18DRAFT_447515 [Chaetomium sp. MPI-SDFR-AT-0129]|nr:hypothetical protein B0J18DRAFT_447515 [Chaetomium sp. MPI-SDFR-AT-0129]